MVDSRIHPSLGFARRFKPLKAAFAASAAALAILAGCMELNAPSSSRKGADENELSTALATTATLQAEAAVVSGALKLSANAGYTGTGYVDFQAASGEYIEWTVSIPQTGSYELRFRYANGATTSRPLAISHKHSTATSFTTFTSGQAFPGTGSWTTWKTVAPKFTFSKTGTFKVRAASTGSSGGNIDYLQVYGPVTAVNTPPSITSQPSSKTVAVGGSATFSVSAGGTSPLTYQWQRNGANISGAASASYTRSNVQSTDNASTYRCVVKNAYGTATSGSATLTVTTGTPAWRNANLTWFTSYPAPGSEECNDYSGCEWEGQFAALPDKMSEEWVRTHNIIAVHEKDFTKYKLKTFRIKQGTSHQIDAVVYDMCADSDCDGCCTRNANANGSGFLIDMEKYTKDRFGSSSGTVSWTCLNCN